MLIHQPQELAVRVQLLEQAEQAEQALRRELPELAAFKGIDMPQLQLQVLLWVMQEQ